MIENKLSNAHNHTLKTKWAHTKQHKTHKQYTHTQTRHKTNTRNIDASNDPTQCIYTRIHINDQNNSTAKHNIDDNITNANKQNIRHIIPLYNNMYIKKQFQQNKHTQYKFT